MFNRKECKEKAKQVYKGNYLSCILASGIVFVINMVFGGNSEGSKVTINFSHDVLNQAINSLKNAPVLYTLTKSQLAIIVVLVLIVGLVLIIVVGVFVSNMLRIGLVKFYTEARSGNYDINNLLFAYRNGYTKNSIVTMLMKDLSIILWALLLIIPGIIKAYELRFVPYILAEDPSLSREEVLSMSKSLTSGHKMDLFVLDLSFIGWKLFDIITLGFGQFLTLPYYEATDAEVYAMLKE